MSIKNIFWAGLITLVLVLGHSSTPNVFAATQNITVSNVTSTTASVDIEGLAPGAQYSIRLAHEIAVSFQEFTCNATQNCNTTSHYVFAIQSLIPNTDYSLRLSDSSGALLASKFFSTPSSTGTAVSLAATISSISTNSARVDVSVTNGEVSDGINVRYGTSQNTSNMNHSDPMNENSDGTYDLVLGSLASCTTYYYTIQDSEDTSTFYTSVKSFQTLCQTPNGNPPTVTNPALSAVNITATTVRFQASGLTPGETYDIYYYNDDSNNSVGHVDLDAVTGSTVTTSAITLPANTYIGKLFNDTDLNSISTTNSFIIVGTNDEGGACGDGFVMDPVINECVPEQTGGIVEYVEDDGESGMGQNIVKLKNPLGNDNNSIPKILVTIVDNVILPIAIPFLALAIIWTGFQFVLARGNTEKLKKAKEALWWTLLGAGVILGAYVIAQVIQSTINEIRGETVSLHDSHNSDIG